jgi:hypothetical protein
MRTLSSIENPLLWFQLNSTRARSSLKSLSRVRNDSTFPRKRRSAASLSIYGTGAQAPSESHPPRGTIA